MSAVLRFESSDYVYLSCYTQDGELISSNYYDNDTINRGDEADLRVINNCLILGVCKRGNKYYQMTPMVVTDATMLPPSGIIRLVYSPRINKAVANLSDINIFYVESPSDVATTLRYNTTLNITNAVTPLTQDNSSNIKNCYIMGNMAVPMSANRVGQFYDNQNICIQARYIDKYLQNSKYVSKEYEEESKFYKIFMIIVIIIWILLLIYDIINLGKAIDGKY